MSHLTILLPFGLPPAEISADLLKALNMPSLAALLARARFAGAGTRHRTFKDFSRALPHEIWLAREFGIAEDLERSGNPPVAVPLMRAFGCAPQEAGTWFVLQPVHIHVARDHLVLTDPRRLALPDQEARALFDLARPLFDEAGKTVRYGDAATWFLRADEWKALETATPDAASGHNIEIWMPRGAGERDWRKLQNEVQMHWFDHAVNQDREARGVKPVNSLWLWGGSPAPAADGHGGYTAAFNLTGWYRAFIPRVARCGAAASAADALAAAPERGLAVLDDLLEPALSNDWSAWLAAMQALEARWFAPLLEALRSNALEHLSLVLTHDTRLSRFDTTRASLRKFWIRPALTPLSP